MTALCRLKGKLQRKGQTAATANDRCLCAFLEHDEPPASVLLYLSSFRV
jgi:hypothetical protein